jgi:integrase
MLLKQLERVPAVYEEKEPYTDEELKLIWAKAKEMNRGTRGYAKYPETFVLLLDFMLETNLRVGDAVNLDPSRLTVGISGKLWVYTYEPEKQKIASMKKTMDAYLTDELKTAIEKCEWMSRSRPFKYDPLRPPNDPSYWASEVYFRMQAIAKRCGVIDCRPHRLRDTYAVRKLNHASFGVACRATSKTHQRCKEGACIEAMVGTAKEECFYPPAPGFDPI